MVHFSCICLNVRIHGRGETPLLRDVTNIHVSEEAAMDPFFSPESFVVTMDVCGVTKSQELLCKDRVVDGWIITTCLSCMFDACASHPAECYRVLVNSDIKKEDHISAMTNNIRYSRVFKLVLPEVNDNFLKNNLGIEFGKIPRNSSVEYVQKSVSNYLRNEQRDMEERIRKFNEVQQTNYADLLQKVRKQKQSMIYLVLQAKEHGAGATDENEEEVSESPETSTEVTKEIKNASSTSTDSAFDKSEASVQSVPPHHARRQNIRSLRRTVSNPAHPVKKEKKKGPRRPPVTVDVGGVFEMEEFDSREEYSDEDSEVSEGEMEDSNHDQSVYQMMCATSLPMSIPAFSHYSHFSVIEDEEDDFKASLPKDDEEIAASMRALALSVTDGTEMFGELPRRRLNTGELLSAMPGRPL